MAGESVAGEAVPGDLAGMDEEAAEEGFSVDGGELRRADGFIAADGADVEDNLEGASRKPGEEFALGVEARNLDLDFRAGVPIKNKIGDAVRPGEDGWRS